jgi:hypothetical protein
MQCPQCGATITEGWRQCPYCQYSLETPQTGQQNGDEAIIVVDSVDTTLLPAVTPSPKPGNWFAHQLTEHPWLIIPGLAIVACILIIFVLTNLLHISSPTAVFRPTTATATPYVAASMANATPTVTVPPATNTVAPSLTIMFTCSTVTRPHNRANICVRTLAGAHVMIAALRCDGQPDGNLQPTTRTTNNFGDFQWSWRMQDPGSCRQESITVRANSDSGQTGQNSVSLSFT